MMRETERQERERKGKKRERGNREKVPFSFWMPILKTCYDLKKHRNQNYTNS